MPRKTLQRAVVIGTIASVCVAFWSFSLVKFVTEWPDLKRQFAEFREQIALPQKMAALSALSPDSALFLPVRGVLMQDVTDTWRQARSGGRTHEGTDIFANRGTTVYSATEGYVWRVGVNDLGGNYVMVLGAGGRRYYYAHLYAASPLLTPGTPVSTSTILGYVGNTGNATATPHHLHFGVYMQGGAVNPFPLLIDR